MRRAAGLASIRAVRITGTPPHRFLYDSQCGDSRLTRTDLWAWHDALRRLQQPSAGEHAEESAGRDAGYRDRLGELGHHSA
jgi:hypothetical protein